MKEQLISFETAKLAKEKGIDFVCHDGYTKKGRCLNYRNNWWKDRYMYAPTQSLLQKWLREEKGVEIWIQPSFGVVPEDTMYLSLISNGDEVKSTDNKDTYEEALEEGLKEALKLI